MTSENYRQLLNNEFEAKEMTKEDFDNTLMHFAMLYHTEQLKLYDVSNRRELLIDFLDDVLMCQDEGATIVDKEKYVDGYLGN